jgi:hypothetical protein
MVFSAVLCGSTYHNFYTVLRGVNQTLWNKFFKHAFLMKCHDVSVAFFISYLAGCGSIRKWCAVQCIYIMLYIIMFFIVTKLNYQSYVGDFYWLTHHCNTDFQILLLCTPPLLCVNFFVHSSSRLSPTSVNGHRIYSDYKIMIVFLNTMSLKSQK